MAPRCALGNLAGTPRCCIPYPRLPPRNKAKKSLKLKRKREQQANVEAKEPSECCGRRHRVHGIMGAEE